MTVYVTRYALTDGIEELEADTPFLHDPERVVIKDPGGAQCSFRSYRGEGRDWHRTRESAVTRAEHMRTVRIKSLRKQIAALEKLTF